MSSKVTADAIQGEGPVSAINVTPLVDVMLCLLIIFMVSTPMMAPKQPHKIAVPKAKAQAIAQEQFLLATVSVDAKGDVFMGTVALSRDPATMANELSSNARLKQDGVAFIQGDSNIEFSRIVEVLVALRTAGVSKVGFLTDPKVPPRT
ncbi:Cell division and transport-associated protein TolR [Nannocystis exedens]|uniref:Cell division and transport-associated protein TolR n=1 Tax=Nannocystis exedens TaxID=54 RepID=A0A1I2FXC9_9BACT|nr:biopolymer transporter ExbD [Nannocystis exedens]PCC74541.1 transport energizing protein TolR [Nannocystis exedens]SFF10064.1 Cell division and transport-associated protein TolR [Nannocystis exedens]